MGSGGSFALGASGINYQKSMESGIVFGAALTAGANLVFGLMHWSRLQKERHI